MKSKIPELERLVELVARAIPRERGLQQVYGDAATWAPTDATRKLFELLHLQETQHIERLEEALRILRHDLRQARAPRPPNADPSEPS